jgi:hypothetical protein
MQLTIAIEKRGKEHKILYKKKTCHRNKQASSCDYEQALCSIEGIREEKRQERRPSP